MLASAFTWRTRLRALAVGLWRKAVRRQERRYRPRTDGERRPEVAPGCRASSVAQLADGGEAFALLAGGAGRCAPLDGSGHCLAVMDRGSGFEGPPRAAASSELRQGGGETRALKSCPSYPAVPCELLESYRVAAPACMANRTLSAWSRPGDRRWSPSLQAGPSAMRQAGRLRMRGAQVASNAALSMQPTEGRQGLRRARTSSVHAKSGREGFLAKSCRGGLRLEQHALPFSWRCVQRQKQHSKALAEPRAVPTVRSEGTSAARPVRLGRLIAAPVGPPSQQPLPANCTS